MFYDGGHYKGGPLNNAISLLPNFVKKGHEVQAIVLSFHGESIAHDALSNFDLQIVKLVIPGYREDLAREIARVLNKFNPDVFIPNICLSGLIIAKQVELAGVPCVAAHRSNDDRNWMIAKRFAIEPKSRLSGLVCVSEFLAIETQRKTRDKLNITVIPSGVQLPLEPKKDNGSNVKLVYSGRLVEEQKRIQDVLDGFIDVCLNDQKAICSFIGTGKEEGRLKAKVAEAGLVKQIIFHGYLTGDEYNKTLREHDCIVLLSEYEGTPGSLMDGMANGLIPIATNFQGATELIDNDNNGYIIQNSQELKGRVKEIYESKGTKKSLLSQRAFVKIRESYSVDSSVNKWLELFAKLIEAHTIEKRNIVISNDRLTMLSEYKGYEYPYPHPWYRWKLIRRFYILASRIKTILIRKGE